MQSALLSRATRSGSSSSAGGNTPRPRRAGPLPASPSPGRCAIAHVRAEGEAVARSRGWRRRNLRRRHGHSPATARARRHRGASSTARRKLAAAWANLPSRWKARPRLTWTLGRRVGRQTDRLGISGVRLGPALQSADRRCRGCCGRPRSRAAGARPPGNATSPPSASPASTKAWPRLARASARVGSRATAARKASRASSFRPRSQSKVPRLFWASANSGRIGCAARNGFGGFVVAPECLQGQTEIVGGLGVIGLQAQRRPAAFDGLLMLARACGGPRPGWRKRRRPRAAAPRPGRSARRPGRNGRTGDA